MTLKTIVCSWDPTRRAGYSILTIVAENILGEAWCIWQTPPLQNMDIYVISGPRELM